MRLIVLAPVVLLASLVPDPAQKPKTDQEDRHGFQLTDHELQTACAIMDESLRDVWHTPFTRTIRRAAGSRFQSTRPIAAEDRRRLQSCPMKCSCAAPPLMPQT